MPLSDTDPSGYYTALFWMHWTTNATTDKSNANLHKGEQFISF